MKYFALACGLIAVFTGFTLHPPIKGSGIKVIVIDAGHGGKDPGCSGAAHNEKEVALAVALKLGKLIEENYKDIKVIYTRTTDVFVELEDRAQIANKAKADLFISIHCNAAGMPVMIKDPKTGKKRPKMYKNKKGRLVAVEKPNPVPFGTETYVMGLKNEEGKMKVATRENSAIFYEEDYEKKYGGFDPESEESYIIMSNYTSAYVIQSASLAMKIQEEYTSKAGRIDKGVHRQSIWVLWRTSMPSILTELGYLTNPLEETFMASDNGQDYLAKAIFRGFRRYKDEVEGKKKEYDDEFEKQTPLENENVKAGNLPGQKKASDDDDDEEVKELVEKEKKEPEKPAPEPLAPPVVKEKLVKEVKEEKKEVKDNPNDVTLVPPDEPVILTIKKDTLVSLVEDTMISAASIAERFKKESKKQPQAKTPEAARQPVKTEKQPAMAKVPESKAPVEKAAPKAAEGDIVFKVQFASSDVPLNLKQEKYAAVVDGDFYKMKNIFKYTSGSFSSVKEAVQHQSLLREKGFKDCFVVALKNGERLDVNTARQLLGQ